MQFLYSLLNIKNILTSEFTTECQDLTLNFKYLEEFIEITNQYNLYSDSKDIVDLTPKKDLKDIVKDLKRLLIEELNLTDASQQKETNKNYLIDFIKLNFHPLEETLKGKQIAPIPEEKISLKYFKEELFKSWKILSKTTEQIDGSTAIPLKYPFVVPGGRFREMYYWDSYWIIKGLLKSNLKEEAKNMIKNFIDVIFKFKFFPNGTRTYYLNRTQQPYFIQILEEAFNFDSEYFSDIIADGLKAAEMEMDWFEKNRTQIIEFNENKHIFYIFNVRADGPRPESYKEDKFEYSKVQDKISQKDFFSNISTIAESGWDFSTRWLKNKSDRNEIMIRELIPADLNALMYKNFISLAKFYKIKFFFDEKLSLKYQEKAEKLKNSINEVLWNESTKSWNDYNFVTKIHNSEIFYFSNLIPMLYGIDPPKNYSFLEILKEHKDFIFGHAGGIPATEYHSGEINEQWDFPNAWAPHQEMMVTFLLEKNLFKLALHVASVFFVNVYEGFKKTGAFFEKYNVKSIGLAGCGGEYVTQIGFGWTNGVIVEFITIFGDNLLFSKNSVLENNLIANNVLEMKLFVRVN